MNHDTYTMFFWGSFGVMPAAGLAAGLVGARYRTGLVAATAGVIAGYVGLVALYISMTEFAVSCEGYPNNYCRTDWIITLVAAMGSVVGAIAIGVIWMGALLSHLYGLLRKLRV